jgi:Carbohydrate-selective porin, OprB family
MCLSGNSVAAQTVDDGMMEEQVSVEQLTDVKPTDWAYKALKSLSERYNCLTSSSGKSSVFEGDRAVTRYEFADGLHLCLQQMEKLIGNVSNDFIKKDDLSQLGRLGQEFQPELIAIKNRVDQVESKTAKLEGSQFSPKVKLNGEVIVGFNGIIGDKKAVTGTANPTEKLNDNITFSDRVRLNFDVFNLLNETDRLRVRLQAANTIQFNRAISGTVMSRVGFDTNNNNNFEVHRLEYYFKPTEQLKITIAANGEGLDDMLKTYSSLFEGAATGSISALGRFAPIYRQSIDGSGVAINYDFSKDFGVTLGYLATPKQASNPLPGKGLFNGGYSLFTQFNWKPNDSLSVGFTYVNSYENPNTQDVRLSGNTGSLFANQPFGNIPTSSHHLGLEGSYKVFSNVFLDVSLGYTQAQAEITSGLATKGNGAEMLNWAVKLGIGDDKKNLLGLIFAMPPKAISNDITTRQDHDTSYHIEGFYRYRVDKNDDKTTTNKIYITPGFIVILNPEHNANNEPIFVGTIRSTFLF